MLAVRIIPALLFRGRTLVKGSKFNSWRSVGHVQQAVKIHQARWVDELIVLDIAATPAGRGPDFALVESLTDGCFMPITYGGGVRSPSDVARLLGSGADKISIGTAAYESDFIIKQCADFYGCQCIVYSLDVMGNTVMTHCGKHGYSHSPLHCALWAQDQGAGEILLTSIDKEGTMEGYDLDLIREISSAVDIPVVAHGGCSGYEDMYNAIQVGASAVAAGALFQFTDATPKGAALYLKEKGIEVRL